MTRFHPDNGHARAFRRWFQQSEAARKVQRLGPGRRPKGLPKPPTSPEELHRLIHEAAEIVGPDRACQALGIHRTTLSRWLAGETQAPPAAVLVLRLMADGLHPNASDEWTGFRFDGDRLMLPDGRYYTAREIQGWHYHETYIKALESQAQHLERKIAYLVKLNRAGAANDALHSARV